MSRIAALAIGMILGGALLLGSSLIIVKGDITMFNSKNSHHVDRTFECKDEIDSLSIRESSGSVIVQSADVSRATVSYSDYEDEPIYEISESDGKLHIERNKDSGFHFFRIDFSDHKMIVTLPESFHGHVELNNSSGSVHMNEVSAEDISVENTSGSIRLEDVSSDEELNAKNTSGSIQLIQVEAGAGVRAENTSGSIKLENLRSGGDVFLKTTSGSIKGTIAGQQSDYRIHTSVTSGSCSLKDTDEGDKKLDAQVSSGSIRIQFTGR